MKKPSPTEQETLIWAAAERLVRSMPRDDPLPLGLNATGPTAAENEFADTLASIGRIAHLTPCYTSMECMQQAYAMILSAGRCAVWAARYRKRAYYEASLVALIMSDGVVDFRDLLRSIAIVYRCGQIIGYSPHEELNAIADASNSVNTKSVIKNGFLARDETLRSLTAFGINQVGGEDGLWFCASHSI